MKLGDEAEDDDETAEKANDKPAQDEQLATAAKILDVAGGCAAPELADSEEDGEGDSDDEDAEEKGAQNSAVFRVDGEPPSEEVGAALFEGDDLLAEGNGGCAQDLEGGGDGVVGFSRLLKLLGVGGGCGFGRGRSNRSFRRRGEILAFADHAANDVGEGSSEVEGLLVEGFGVANGPVDIAPGAEQLKQDGGLAADT